MKTAFVVDSSASLSNKLSQHPDVYVLDLLVTWEHTSYHDTKDDKLMKDFYTKLTQSDFLPTTSQPTPGQIIQLFEQLVAAEYDNVFFITLSKGISGAYQTIHQISCEFIDQMDVYMIDSKGTSFIMENMVRTGLDLSVQGAELTDIEDQLNWLADHSKIHVVIRNLHNLVKGGRLSSASAMLGQALKIYPILEFDQGEVVVVKKVRSMRRVYNYYIKLVDQAMMDYPDGFEIAIAHGDCEADAFVLRDLIHDKYPQIQFRIGYLTPVLGSHGGKDALGMGIMPQILRKNSDPSRESRQLSPQNNK